MDEERLEEIIAETVRQVFQSGEEFEEISDKAYDIFQAAHSIMEACKDKERVPQFSPREVLEEGMSFWLSVISNRLADLRRLSNDLLD